MTFRSNQKAMAQAEAADDLKVATLADGRRFLIGQTINGMLVNYKQPERCIWNLLSGTAMGAGVRVEELPALEVMLRHAFQALGGEGEGMPDVPADHRPELSARALLHALKPLAIQCLTGEVSQITAAHKFQADRSSWQAVTAWCAAMIFGRTHRVLQPRVAITIAMEAAFYGSMQLADG